MGIEDYYRCSLDNNGPSKDLVSDITKGKSLCHVASMSF